MATFTSKATGNWETEGQTTWNEAGHPVAGDTVTVANAHVITLGAAAACTLLTIDDGGEVTDATNNAGLTISNRVDLYGTLTCGSAAMQFGSAASTNYGLYVYGTGVFVGGSGAHSIWALRTTTSSTVTLSSGTTSFTGYYDFGGQNYTLVFVGETFDDGDGTIAFTHASDDQEMWCAAHVAHTFQNLTINKAAGIVRFGSSACFALTVAGALTVTSGEMDLWDGDDSASASLTVTGATSITGTLDGKAAAVDFNGNFTINGGGSYVATSGTTYFTGTTWTTTGTFTHSSGSVVFDGTNQEIDGTTSWNNFDKHVAAAATLTIDNTSTQTVAGTLVLYGAASQLLSVLSDSAGNAWSLVLTGAKGTVSYLSVKDSDASGSDADVKPINPASSTNVSGNTDWFPTITQPAMQVVVIS